MDAARQLAAALAAAALVACSPSTPAPAQPTASAPTPGHEPTAAPAAPDATPPPPEVRRAGTPHLMAIERVALSPDGDAAITRDSAGRLRFWASLDGKVEPMPIPLDSASHFALARGKTIQGRPSWTIAIVDTAGGGHILRAFRDGAMQRLSDVGGFAKLSMVDVEVFRGGERVSFLRTDRVIELRDVHGKLLAFHDQRGFRPSKIMLAGAGELVAFELEPGSTSSELTAHTLRVVSRAADLALEPVGDGYTITVPSFAVSAGQLSVSPTGRRVAFLGLDPKKQTWDAVIADLKARSHQTVPMPQMQRHQTPALGFVADDKLIARGGVNASTWMIELDEAGAEPRLRPLSVRGDVANNGPRSFAGSVMAVGLGNWLYVYRADTGRSLYLGYEQFSPMAAAVSPSGKVVAWGNNEDLFVTTPTGERLADRHLTRFQTVRHIAFVDEDRLVIAYYTGALELYEWKTGKVIAAVDGGGSYTSGGYDAERQLYVLIPMRGQVWVTEVTRSGFRGPYVIIDGANRAGVLAGEQALWTVDNGNRLRSYTLDEIRAGVSSADIDKRGVLIGLTAVNVARDGRIFASTYANGSSQLAVYPAPEMPEPSDKTPRLELRNKELAMVPMASGVGFSELSPDGRRIAVVSNNVVFVRDAADLKVMWSYPFPNGTRSISWSASGARLAVATREGALLFDATSGDRIHASCGARFEARATPPSNLHPPNINASVCER